MLDTPRLSFEKFITNKNNNSVAFQIKDEAEKVEIKGILQQICDIALTVYLKRNSAYIYI
jgi:hypothetical protein